MKCASCKDKKCYKGKDCTEIKEEAKADYTKNKENLEIMKVASTIEAKYYMKLTRIEEIIEFAQQRGYKKLGIAFCIGLQNEAGALNKILSKYFEVYSVVCKVCGIDKNDFSLDKLHDSTKLEAICNPIGQAKILNKKKTELNIALGLCIGHDILFAKYSQAPVTTLAVKDRVLAHNPLGAIYSRYYYDVLRTLKGAVSNDFI